MELKKLKLMEVPEIKPINVPKRQSLQEWHFANGSVPERYKGNPHAWHKKVQRLAEGGSVYNTQPDMSDGGQIIPEQQMARGGAAKAKPFKASDLAEPFTEGLFPMIYGGAKGTVAGLAGLPGELESLARAGYNYGSRLSPQAPLSRETFFPTIEEVSRALPSTGRKIEEPYTKLGENMLAGLVNPAAVYRTGVRGAQALAPKLGQAADRYMTEMGMMPGVAPKGMPAPKGEKPIVVRTPEEQSVIDKFGQKHEQEAARAKKVLKAAKLAEESAGKSPEKQIAKPGGQRVKVDPDVYRKMAESQGEEAVLKAVRAGEHLKPTSKGFVGAPRTVTNQRTLNAMRKGIDQDFSDSVDAVKLADPDRMGTWYDRAKMGIGNSTELYQVPRTIERHSVYSAGVSPEAELGFALKDLNSRVAGQPEMAFRKAAMKKLDEAAQKGVPAKLAFKIGEYGKKNDPRLPNTGLFGVDDFRRAQGMQYTLPEGSPWQGGVTDTMHPFMDAETALQVDRANKAGIGGRTDWHGPHIQELPWVYGKAQDFHARGKKGRYSGDELEGIKQALRDANNTAQDYMYKHTASATHEAVPGASLGHVPQVLGMTPEEKLAYGMQGRWDVLAPEQHLNPYSNIGGGSRDSLYGAAGYRQLPSRQAEGLYHNKLDEIETNPMTMARPLMDFPTGGGGGIMDPKSSKVMETLEQFRALADAQEAGAFNLPNTMNAVKAKNSMVLDARSSYPDKLGDPTAGVTPTASQLSRLNDVLEGSGFGVSSTNRGAVIFPFDSSMSSKDASKFLKKNKDKFSEIFPSEPMMAKTTTGYVPGVGKRGESGPLSTVPYSGEATSDMLSAFSEIPQHVVQNIGESEAVRQAIREKALRDYKLGGARGDIQETRRFMSEADWPKAVEMIRQGMAPAAAIAALGYNAASMASEK